MTRYATLSDDFYVNLNLNTEMDLPGSRETILHFFEQIQKKYPSMRNFYSRERGEYVLEEDKDRGHYRWVTVDSRRVCSGYVNPESTENAIVQHRLVLDLIPYAMSISPLDCESLNLMFGFDFTYRGNHNQLVAEALGVPPALERLMHIPGATMVSYEPNLQFSVDDDCRIQCRVGVETRTSAYHVRTREYPEEQISVYVTARRFGSLDPGETYVGAIERLSNLCQEIVDDYVVDSILLPLQQAIAIK